MDSDVKDYPLEMAAAAELLAAVVNHPDVRRQMGRDHFSVDGILIDAWASMKCFKRKDDPGGDGPQAGRNTDRDFCSEKRSNEAHASTTDPDVRLYEKADRQPSRLCFVGTSLMENRNGLVVDGRLTRVSGISECFSAVDLADAHICQCSTLVGEKISTPPTSWPGSLIGASPRVSPRTPTTPAPIDLWGAERRYTIDGSTARHAGYAVSQKCRKRIEQIVAMLNGILAEVALSRLGAHGARFPPRPNAQATRRQGRMMAGHKDDRDDRGGAERWFERATRPTRDALSAFDVPHLLSAPHALYSQATPDASPTYFSAAC